MSVGRSSSVFTATITLLVWILSVWICLTEAESLVFHVNKQVERNGSTVSISNRTSVCVECYYDFILRTKNPETNPKIFSPIHSGDLSGRTTLSPDSKYYILEYDVPNRDKTGKHVYYCGNEDLMVMITLVYSTGNSNEGSANEGSPSTFAGMNPLIYTISAVILLGTLAIVAIVTCWIRARRSFNNRMFRPNTTSQDYFDYINDSEFTPLTSSEFAASLQERPPTYIESERIEQSDNESGNAGNMISPIPPPPQPHNLPSLTRLRVVQLENIALIADRAQTIDAPQSTEHNSGDSPLFGDLPLDVPTTNLIDLADNRTTVQPRNDDPYDDPLYT